ncbi:MFS transporter [Paenibacillus bovis]|uniref:Multidrug transporter n=1 Tax=Paenibacillus bovis TaxID=1616788 RepID=A0A172ZFP6_9BACL|nr:MFS transporter [Paenibacillus bovis]ANF96471.1 multidrug transporter [Paenibacillus bovis]
MALLFRNRAALLLLMFNIFLVFTGIGLVIPIMPTYMNELHIGGSILGLMVAAFSISQLVFSPFTGRLSDRVGRKKLIIAGMVIFAVSEWLFAIANAPGLLFVSRMIGGLGAALIMPSVMAYAADITSNEERGAGMGFINAAITTGFIIGPGIGGLLAEYGIRVPFYAAAIAGLIAAVATLILLPESLSPERRAQLATVQDAGPRSSLVRQLMESYRKPYFLSLVIVFVASFGLANYETVFSLFVDHKFGFTARDIAIIITFGSIAGAVVQATIFGWMINRFGGQRLIVICLIASAVFIMLTLMVHTYFLIFVVTFAVFLAMDILRPAIGTQLSQNAGDEQGYIAGLNSAYTSLGNIAGPVIAGALFDLDINYPYVLAAVVLCVCFMLAMRVKPPRWNDTQA